MIYPESLSDTIGLVTFTAMFVLQYMTKDKHLGPKPAIS